jgi:hypothetical protein
MSVLDEIDAVGTKRYDSNSGGEREIQRYTLFKHHKFKRNLQRHTVF